MSEEPKREKHELQAGKFDLGGPDFAKPVLTPAVVPLQAQSLELSLEWPGYDVADRCALRFFVALMRAHPDGTPGKKKGVHLHECQEHLRAHGHGEHDVSPRRLDQLWTRAIDYTDAVAFRTPGPK
jgi:hypothetical protein